MQLDPTRWFVKLFFWSVGIWDAFTERDLEEKMARRTNLCFFVRVITLWMPLSILANVAIWAAAISVVTYLPVRLFGFGGYLWIFAGISFVVLTVWFFRSAKAWFRESRERSRTQYRLADFVQTAPDRGPGAIDVAKKWVSARKSKFCPIITFKNTEAAR